NTTGRRWKSEEIQAALSVSLEIFAFDVEDKYTGYGLVGLVLVQQDEIVQFVMSCRVVGLDVEFAALSSVIDAMRVCGTRSVTALYANTDANILCRDLFAVAGLKEQNGHWVLEGASAPKVPAHIDVRLT